MNAFLYESRFCQGVLQVRVRACPDRTCELSFNIMSDDAQIFKIRKLATRFRNAIESLNVTELPLTLHKFPRGSCGDTCEMLGAYFIDQNLGEFKYIRAKRWEGHNEESHGWLKQDNLIVDITADQFNEGINKVFVSENSEWHENSWTIIDSRVANYRNDPNVNYKIEEYYHTISSKADSAI